MEDTPVESTWNRKRSFDDAVDASLPRCRFCLVTQRSSIVGGSVAWRDKTAAGETYFFLVSFLKLHFFYK